MCLPRVENKTFISVVVGGGGMWKLQNSDYPSVNEDSIPLKAHPTSLSSLLFFCIEMFWTRRRRRGSGVGGGTIFIASTLYSISLIEHVVFIKGLTL